MKVVFGKPNGIAHCFCVFLSRILFPALFMVAVLLKTPLAILQSSNVQFVTLYIPGETATTAFVLNMEIYEIISTNFTDSLPTFEFENFPKALIIFSQVYFTKKNNGNGSFAGTSVIWKENGLICICTPIAFISGSSLFISSL